MQSRIAPPSSPRFRRTRLSQMLQLGLLASAAATCMMAPPAHAARSARRSVAIAKPATATVAPVAAAPVVIAQAADDNGPTYPIYFDGSAAHGAKGNDGNCGSECIISGKGNGGDAPATPGALDETWEVDNSAPVHGDATHPVVTLISNGGNGGAGGNAASADGIAWNNGGKGADGGVTDGVVLQLDEGSSTTQIDSGTPAVVLTTNGGHGGTGGLPANYGSSGANGAGGQGGDIIVKANGSIVNQATYTGTTLAPSAIVMTTVGGDGGGDDSSSAKTSSDKAQGPTGGKGGDGGAITFTAYNADGTAPTIWSDGAGIVAVSAGGNGGQGGEANTTGLAGATGGAGGAGGNGGKVIIGTSNASVSSMGVQGTATAEAVTVDPAHPSVQAAQSFTSAAILAQSLGGSGGTGGSGDGSFAPGHGGAGGAAGSGGTVIATTAGNIDATAGSDQAQYGSAGIVAQSIGGSGGNGAGAGSVFKVHGGAGGKGGDGGQVTVEADDLSNATLGNHALVRTHGDDANAITAQSIGGGGGNGGSVAVQSGLVVPLSIAIGGNAESGGNGGVVNVNIGSVDPGTNALTPGALVSTQGARSAGVLAQSIGGGGGNGGSASAKTIGGVLSLAIGGTGGSGGTAGSQDDGYTQVTVNNYGTVQTDGIHSAGIVAQAIGGGGGNGGAASALDAGAQITMAVAVGGNGGSGGTAGGVLVNNHGQIVTEQADSYGVLAQSIGGGGGNGGASWAETLNVFNSPDVPSVNMTSAVGGKGVSGGNGGDVTVTNDAFVATRGAGSIGLFAQSVGGGGGNGGDSSATQIAMQNSNVSVSVGIGGSGGAGGTGGNVSVTNDAGAVMTYGANAIGVFGQSVGGGGGSGGFGKTDTASFLSESKGMTLTVGIGGNGGTGNTGGNVTVRNLDGGSVTTMGDGARGVAAQSIGGSGGVGGASNAGGSGGTMVVNVSLAGNGGSGNHGGIVSVQNDGTILTLGGKADAIFAQSVGGSGGVGGTAAAGGGTDPELRVTDYIQKGLGIGGKVTQLSDNIYGFAKDELVGDKAIAALREAATNYVQSEPAPPAPAPDADSSWSVSVDVGTAKGGTGGSGGDGQAVTVTNTATIETDGPNSAGIYAQSIGGSGGVGGMAQAVNNPQGLAQKNVPLSGSIGIGGGGGSSGQGGDVVVINQGSITTNGAASNGVTAQSVGGGGGEGGATVASWQQVHALNVSLGGNGGANGDGGQVTVSLSQDGASLATHGASSNGIVAQSIGGGGGLATLMAAAPSSTAGGTMQSDISWLPQGFAPSVVPVNIGGQDGEHNCGATGKKASGCGNGGEVDVTASNVTTTGANAHAIVAQSIGGGGGMIVGVTSHNGDIFGSNAMIGDGGKVNVTVDRQMNLGTGGDGSYGVLAQSIGGGGILSGDTSHTDALGNTFEVKNPNLSGTGNDVHIVVGSGSTVQTGGKQAHAVVAQSIGGGGGFIATPDEGVVMGTAGGKGNSGQVTVDNAGTIRVTGAGSSAIVLNSDGQQGNTGGMTVNNTGTIWGDNARDAPAIQFLGNGSRTLNNSSFIASTNGWAVDGAGGNVSIINNPGAQLYGNVTIGQGTLTNNGMWATNDSSTGNVVNKGRLNIWGAYYDQMADSHLQGNLESFDTIHTAVDFQHQTAGKLVVSGQAYLVAGDVLLTAAKTMAPKPVTVLSAGSLVASSSVIVHDDSGSGLYTYAVDRSNSALTVTPQGQFSQVATKQGFSAAERSMAQHLQAGFTPTLSDAMAANYGRLATLPGVQAYQDQLDRLGNESSQAAALAAITSSHSFVERMNSCPQFEGSGTDMREHDCAWSRAGAEHVKRDGSGAPVGYDADNYGLQIGGQRRIGDGWFVGGAMGYDTTSLSADSGQSVSGNGFSAGVVLKRELGDWLLSGAADVGRGSYDTKRVISLGELTETARGQFDATHVGLHGRVTRYVPFDGWYLKPYADMHVTRMNTSAYTETGANELNLHVASESDTSFAVSPMLEAGMRTDIGHGMTLRTYAGAGLAWYDHNGWSASSALSGAAAEAGTFASTAELPDTRYKANLGADLRMSSRFDTRLEYTGEFASGYRVNTATVKVNYLF